MTEQPELEQQPKEEELDVKELDAIFAEDNPEPKPEPVIVNPPIMGPHPISSRQRREEGEGELSWKALGGWAFAAFSWAFFFMFMFFRG